MIHTQHFAATAAKSRNEQKKRITYKSFINVWTARVEVCICSHLL